MFATPLIAAAIDRAEGRMCADMAREVGRRDPGRRVMAESIAGGAVVFSGNDAPANKMIGIGFDGPVDPGTLARVEAAFAERGAPLQAEVSTLAQPAVHVQLAARGYVHHGFENVLARELTARDRTAQGSSDITIEPVPTSQLREWVDVIVDGFAHPDAEGVGGDDVPTEQPLRQWFDLVTSLSGFRYYRAVIDGEVAGGERLRVDGPIAQLTGAATRLACRRRGVQTALLRARLTEAARAGCEFAVVTTQPASRSQRNVQREGFQLLYSRALLVKG